MAEWLAKNGEMISLIIACVVGVNVVLTAVGSAVASIAPKTSNKVDDGIASWAQKISGVVGKIVEFLSANTRK